MNASNKCGEMDKPTARKSAFAARRAAHGQIDPAPATSALMAEIGRCDDIDIVAGYMPIRTEIDVIPAMTLLAAQGKRLCVPVIQREAQPLLFAQWTPDCILVDGPFGAAVPAHPNYLIPDLIIAPLVGFDRRGFRLGYGGGFYDRTFELLRKDAHTPGIGFAYSEQELTSIPVEKTDQPLDALVTENETIRFTRPL
jgi:5-formyltetrahydrofolate cyclo-ligase